MDKKRKSEAEAIFVDNQEPTNVIESIEPIKNQASISTDGGFVHIRDEGWKEAKLVTISAVRQKKKQKKERTPMVGGTNHMSRK